MNTRHQSYTWSLRPEDLLIESARHRIAASTAVTDPRQSQAQDTRLKLDHELQPQILAPRRALTVLVARLVQPWRRVTTPSRS